MVAPHHAIKMVSRRTGLTAHVIRICEKRYSSVEPERTSIDRRLYSEEQIERLSRLRDITDAGHSIGHIPKLLKEKLRKSAAESQGSSRQDPGALALLVGGAIGFRSSVWLGVALLALGLFVPLEVLRGWCVVRARGIQTKL